MGSIQTYCTDPEGHSWTCNSKGEIPLNQFFEIMVNACFSSDITTKLLAEKIMNCKIKLINFVLKIDMINNEVISLEIVKSRVKWHDLTVVKVGFFNITSIHINLTVRHLIKNIDNLAKFDGLMNCSIRLVDSDLIYYATLKKSYKSLMNPSLKCAESVIIPTASQLNKCDIIPSCPELDESVWVEGVYLEDKNRT